MKKITLSAAIMALAMMGCSDAGLDNSVASTSEINSEQILSSANEPLVLAKSAYHLNDRVANAIYGLQPTGGNWLDNHNGYERYQYEDVGIDVELQSRVDLDYNGYEGQGEFHVIATPFYPDNTPFNPDKILVASVIVSDCDFVRYEAKCEWNLGVAKYNKKKDHENTTYALVHTPLDNYGRKLPKDKFYKDVGVVSAYIGIWGSATDLVRAGATYNGGLFEGAMGPKYAEAVYRWYVLDKMREKLYQDREVYNDK